MQITEHEPKRMKSLAIVCFAVFAALDTFPQSEQQPQSGAVDTITFELLLNNDYDDSDSSLSDVGDFLAFHLGEAAPVTSTYEELEFYMFKRYQFGPSRLPETFGAIRKEVLYLNVHRGAKDPWLIPPLPRLRSTKRSKTNPYHSVPRVATYELIRRFDSGFEVLQKGVTEEQNRAGSAYTLVQVTMPRDDYHSLPSELKESPIFRGLTSQLAPIRMPHAQHRPPRHLEITSPNVVAAKTEQLDRTTAATEETEARAFVAQERTETVEYGYGSSAELARAVTATASSMPAAPAVAAAPVMATAAVAATPPAPVTATLHPVAAPLAVADVSPEPPPSPGRSTQVAMVRHPSTESRRATFAEFIANPILGQYNGTKAAYLLILDDGWPDAPAMNACYEFFERLINAKRTRYKLPSVHLERPSGPVEVNNHAAEINEAIRSLRVADNEKRVRVLYVPILLRDGTQAFCSELLKAGWLIKRGESQRLLANPHALIAPLEESAAAFATQAIQDWKERLAAARAAKEVCRPPGAPLVVSHPSDCFYTDGFLLNTVYRLAQTAAEDEKTVFVVNQSWTVNADTIELSPTDRSLTVAATGDDGLDVLKYKVDFAKRCLDGDTYLAVMFVDDKFQPDCGSGTVGKPTEKFALAARAVAYDGDLSSGLCGTSFAAPRVAWFVAAKANPGDGEPPADWRTQIQTLVHNSRYGGQDLWRDIYFDVSRFWQPLPP